MKVYPSDKEGVSELVYGSLKVRFTTSESTGNSAKLKLNGEEVAEVRGSDEVREFRRAAQLAYQEKEGLTPEQSLVAEILRSPEFHKAVIDIYMRYYS